MDINVVYRIRYFRYCHCGLPSMVGIKDHQGKSQYIVKMLLKHKHWETIIHYSFIEN